MKRLIALALGAVLGFSAAAEVEKSVAWQPGEFQVHTIFTGLGEQAFWIMPDGTTMLVDCGDGSIDAEHAAPLPRGVATGQCGAYVADYIRRVNPAKDPTTVDYLMVSHQHDDHTRGLPGVAAKLRFGKVFDRDWPKYDTPCRLDDYAPADAKFIREFYLKHHFKIENFRVGACDQVKMLHGGAKGFSIFNLCCNGVVADETTGEVVDCYAAYPDRQPGFKGKQRLNENGMSIGMIVSYGKFRYFAAGDFSDTAHGVVIEDVLSGHVKPVTVAKVNHHGYESMPKKLVKALAPEAWTIPSLNGWHDTPDTIARISDRVLNPRLKGIYPTYHSPKQPHPDIPAPAYRGTTLVLTVRPGGESYSLDYLPSGYGIIPETPRRSCSHARQRVEQ